jgi:hypothetical protein
MSRSHQFIKSGLATLAVLVSGASTAQLPPNILDMTGGPRAESCQVLMPTVKSLSLKKLQEVAATKNVTVRIVDQDGKALPVTMDYRADRLNVKVVNKKVITATCG